jgi:precorrin-6B C5,15-methyltransferase / cobalt-precorrin-6B C5,C15-methyltransferase
VSASEAKIHIIGIGSDGLSGLTSRARELLTSADVVFGSEHAFRLVPELKAERVQLGPDLPTAVAALAEFLEKPRRGVVLTPGDPLFYGVARYLCDRLGKERFEVLPHVSSMQLAFARIKESWEEAYLTNLATHPLETVLDRIRTAETVGLFTSEQEGPAEVARQLLARGLDYFRAYVCENLGGPDERVTQGELEDVVAMEFAPLNVMILRHKPDRPDRPSAPDAFLRFGNPDDAFAQSRPKSGLITQAEVRALALAQMGLRPGDVVWDVGAGSGSVAIEAARLCDPGTVYAIEQDAADYHLILANAETFGVRNLKAIHGTAPGVFAGLPSPDAIFVGGTGHEVARLLEAAYRALRPGGKLVVNVATLESLTASYGALKSLAAHRDSSEASRPDGRVQVLLVNIARGVEQLETLRFESVNPTFLISVTRRAKGPVPKAPEPVE